MLPLQKGVYATSTDGDTTWWDDIHTHSQSEAQLATFSPPLLKQGDDEPSSLR